MLQVLWSVTPSSWPGFNHYQKKSTELTLLITCCKSCGVWPHPDGQVVTSGFKEEEYRNQLAHYVLQVLWCVPPSSWPGFNIRISKRNVQKSPCSSRAASPVVCAPIQLARIQSRPNQKLTSSSHDLGPVACDPIHISVMIYRRKHKHQQAYLMM